jgi:prepilin peptidase CpaA
MSTMDIPTAAVVVVGFTAVVCDVRTRRIPNVLTFGASAAALLYATVTGGVSGLAMASGGWVLGAALFFPIFALGGMGAGDLKLMAALGAWLGPADTIPLAIFASIAGGVLALVVSLATGYSRQAFTNLRLMLMHWRVTGLQPVPGLMLTDTRSPRLAYAIPITIGALCTLWRH